MGDTVAGIGTRAGAHEIDCALIGHQESWRAAADVLTALRGTERTPIPDDEIRDILPWIPPRAVCHLELGSITGAHARGLYIDSFIPPDRLEAAYTHDNLSRVRAAAAYAIKQGAKIVSLGGFSSILIEGNFDQLPEKNGTVFTTGNSLTVAFIVQGIKKMCALQGRDLRTATLLVVGGTGDVGSACARCLAPLVKRTLLSARNGERLRKLAVELQGRGLRAEFATDLNQFSTRADIVICAASLPWPSLLLDGIAPDALVCDAGYPKNLSGAAELGAATIFFGGLGQVTGGLTFAPDLHGILNRHPFPDVAHGCLLEGMALALERRFEPFSRGRGYITPERVREIEAIAARHGIYLAPFYNADGPLEPASVLVRDLHQTRRPAAGLSARGIVCRASPSMQAYARGPAGIVLRKTIGEAFLETAAQFPTRLAISSRHQQLQLTWSDYAAAAQRVAAGLRALGLKPGDRAGIWASNCAEWVMLQFGCALAGVVLVNINPAYRTSELSFVLNKSRIRALFLHERDHRTDYRRILHESRADQTLALEHVIYLDSADWSAFLREPDGMVVHPDPDEPANIQYTSGTTGSPKGVLLTHVNLVNNGRFIAQYLRLSEHDRICIPVPLFHCFGSVIGTMAAAMTGAACLFPAAIFDPLATLEAIDADEATAVYGVPGMFIAELNHADFRRFRLTSLRTGVMAGAPCPVEIMKRVVFEMRCPEMLVGYGQTESTPIITMSHVEDGVETRCTTVGCPLPETEVRIASPDGETLSVGEQGELLARGYMVMKGYDDEPEATARAVDGEGWLHTGDVALMRPDGYFKITGRAKDMIIRGGENISPREIEEFLHTHPGVSDVQVIGIPDERLGEAVVAWVRLRPGAMADEDEIRAYCREKLAYFKIPQFVRFVDAYPTTLSGKVQKFKMREFEIESRGLGRLAAQQTA